MRTSAVHRPSREFQHNVSGWQLVQRSALSAGQALRDHGPLFEKRRTEHI